eukprot:4960063-Pleurochrysis_carterae.AAC.2
MNKRPRRRPTEHSRQRVEKCCMAQARSGRCLRWVAGDAPRPALEANKQKIKRWPNMIKMYLCSRGLPWVCGFAERPTLPSSQVKVRCDCPNEGAGVRTRGRVRMHRPASRGAVHACLVASKPRLS